MSSTTRPSDVEIFGVDKERFIAALAAALGDDVITPDEFADTIVVLEKVMGQ